MNKVDLYYQINDEECIPIPDWAESYITFGNSMILPQNNKSMHILILTEDGRKLGYVPQEKNEVLSNLMDAGKLLFGRLNEKTWVDDWLKLDVQVYLRDL